MALRKKVTAANGIVTEYHRIAMIKNDTNQQCTILIHSYLNEVGRQYEKDYEAGKIEGTPQFPYVDARYISMDYDAGMSISRAYEWIKNNLPEFKGAEDVLDEKADACQISGEEFMSMIEGVL